jgi:glucose repression regulatory protein TUP1
MSGSIKGEFDGQFADINSVDFASNGRYIVTGASDCTVRVWDIITWRNTLEINMEDEVTSVAFSPDGLKIAAGNLSGTILVWQSRTGYLMDRFEGSDSHTCTINGLSFSAGQNLISGSNDQTIKIWRLSNIALSGGCIGTFKGHRVCLAFRLLIFGYIS